MVEWLAVPPLVSGRGHLILHFGYEAPGGALEEAEGDVEKHGGPFYGMEAFVPQFDLVD